MKNPLRCLRAVVLGSSLLFTAPAFVSAASCPLSSLDLNTLDQDWGALQKNMSVAKEPLAIAGQPFATGVGTHANSTIYIAPGDSEHFTASVGMNDHPQPGSAEFIVVGDGKVLWRSGVMKTGQEARKVDVPIKGIRLLALNVTDGGDGISNDHADWAEAAFEYTSEKPKVFRIPVSEAAVLTPRPGPAPRINGPKIFGVRPGSPVLYSIPATGERPMTFAVENLPAGLNLDAATGRLTGVLKTAGEYKITLHAKNSKGTAEKTFKIVVGEAISLTPPLGWNSWNCWGENVDQAKMVAAARSMVETGLDQHGWTYINIDDTWQGHRGGKYHAIQPNAKFPDMKACCDEVHSLGLKFGIYSSPWINSYAHYAGSTADNPEGNWTEPDSKYRGKWAPQLHFIGKYSFVKNDVQQWAEWGVDYLKYDWAPNEVPETKEMQQALRDSGRDIVYSLSNATPFKNIKGIAPLAQCWRTTGDIFDTWYSIEKIGFHQDQWAPYTQPGHFNDPDMLEVGRVRSHPSRLLPDEQYTHISLWSLLSAPLLIGCDLTKLDDFTMGLLTNDEVLEVDQDVLCKPAIRVSENGSAVVFAKQLEDGSWAVGLFNRGLLPQSLVPQSVTVHWKDLKISGTHRVRDLWRQKDLGSFADQFTAEVPFHGVVFVRVF